MSIKNSNDTIGNRTRDLPARSAVPEPSAPLRDLSYNLKYNTRFVIELHDILNIYFVKIQREGVNWNVLSYNLGLQGVL